MKKIILSVIIYLFTYLFIALICEPIWPEPNLFGIIIICISIPVISVIHARFWWYKIFPLNYCSYQKILKGNMGWCQIDNYKRQQQRKKWEQEKKEELRKAEIFLKVYDRKQRELAQQKTVHVKSFYRRRPKRK